MKVALLQSIVRNDKEENLNNAYRLASIAKEKGADVAVLPEMFNCPYETEKFPLYAEEKGQESYLMLSKIAKDNDLLLIGGSIPEKDGSKLYNTCYVFDNKGNEIARHRKSHLFDINIKGKQSFKESDSFSYGDDTCVFEYNGHTYGVAICFDIRFAEFFRNLALKGAEAVFVPAAFNMTTGPLHWELSFRARAVDNQYFTIGVAPARARNGKYVSFANSIICNPWGEVLLNAGENEGVFVADIDLNLVKDVREQLPILSQRRPELYYLK